MPLCPVEFLRSGLLMCQALVSCRRFSLMEKGASEWKSVFVIRAHVSRTQRDHAQSLFGWTAQSGQAVFLLVSLNPQTWRATHFFLKKTKHAQGGEALSPRPCPGGKKNQNRWRFWSQESVLRQEARVPSQKARASSRCHDFVFCFFSGFRVGDLFKINQPASLQGVPKRG